MTQLEKSLLLLESQGEVPGKAHPETSTKIMTLALQLSMQGKNGEAEEVLEPAVDASQDCAAQNASRDALRYALSCKVEHPL
jgi:hypothetical protein